MGLDGIELVMEIEDRFGITISDAEAQSLLTVGDLYDLVNGRIAAARQARCQSLGAFLRIRRLTRDCLDQPGLRIRPAAQIAAVVPVAHRAQLWRALADAYGTAPPELRRPRLLRYALVACSAALIMCALSTALIDAAILPLGLFSAATLMIALYVVTSPFRIVPPAGHRTFGDATRRLVGRSSATKRGFTTTEVAEHVRQICVDVLGVKAPDVVPSARFVQDLGVG